MQAFLLIFVLVSCTFIDNLSNDFYLCSLPLLQKEFNIDATLAKLSYSIWFIGGLLGPIPGIFIVEKLSGKKAFWLISLVLAIATCVCIVSQSIYHLIGARLIQSFIIAAFGVYSLVIIQRQLSLHNQVQYFSANNIIGVLSPIIGPTLHSLLISHFSWRFNFKLILIGVLLTIILFKFVRLKDDDNNSNLKKESKPLTEVFKRYIRTIQDKNPLLYLAGPGALIGTIVSYLILSPFIIVEEYKIPINKFNLYHAIPISGYIIGVFLSNIVNKKIIKKFLPYIPLVIVIAIVFIAGLNLLEVQNIFLYLGLIAIVNLCVGFINNTLILNALSLSSLKTMTAAAIGLIGGLICSSLTVIISLLPCDKMNILASVYTMLALFIYRYSRMISKQIPN